MEYTIADPPEKKKPGGKPTRYQPVIDAAYEKPGIWLELAGEHHSSNIQTLKGHGLTVRTARGTKPHTHLVWVMFPEPEPALIPEPKPAKQAKKAS